MEEDAWATDGEVEVEASALWCGRRTRVRVRVVSSTIYSGLEGITSLSSSSSSVRLIVEGRLALNGDVAGAVDEELEVEEGPDVEVEAEAGEVLAEFVVLDAVREE